MEEMCCRCCAVILTTEGVAVKDANNVHLSRYQSSDTHSLFQALVPIIEKEFTVNSKITFEGFFLKSKFYGHSGHKIR